MHPAAKWLVLPIAAWGTTYLAVELALPAAPPLSSPRFAPSWAASCWFALALAVARPLVGSQWLWAAVLGLLNTTLVSAGIVVGTERIGPALAAVLTNTAPFFMALLALLFLHEPVRLATAAAVAVGFGGVVLIVAERFGQEGATFGGVGVGIVLALAGSVAFAAGTVVTRAVAAPSNVVDLVSLTAWQVLFGGILLLPAAAPRWTRSTGEARGCGWEPLTCP